MVQDSTALKTTAILCYFNPGGVMKGAHYITIIWDATAGHYVAYNAPNNNAPFTSIDDFLENEGNTREFISLTVIENKEIGSI